MSNTIGEMFANQGADLSDLGDTETEGLMFIGDGKKYANDEEADKAIAFKDDHITKIEQENASLREAAQKASTIDEVLQSIRDKNNTLDLDRTPQTEGGDHQVGTQDIGALVAKALDEKFASTEQTRTAEANAQSVVDDLTKRYGSRANELYTAKGQELGIDLDTLAATAPKAVLEFFREPTRTGGSYMGSGQNTTNLNRGNTEYGTYEYWNKQMKSGKIKRDKCFAEQHKSLQSMGAAKFYGSNS